MTSDTSTTVPVTFTYRSETANSVQVSGDWDNWSQRVDLEKVPASAESGNDLWQATKQLTPSSKFQYKYIVNENDWHVREDLPTEADHSGNRNNVLESPEEEHAATDADAAEKTTAEVVGAGVVASVGAAIATVVGTDPFETDKTPVATEPGLTAGSGDKKLNEAEQQSALLDAGQGAPAGAAAASKDGLVPTEQLSKLGLSEGKSPADAGAAAIAGAAAAITGAVAAGQSTGQGAISPKAFDTVKSAESSAPASAPAAAAASAPAAEATSATSPAPGTLDQTEATKSLGDAAAAEGPTIGAPSSQPQPSAAKDESAVPAATTAAAAAAVPVGAAAAAAAATDSKKDKEIAPSSETKAHNDAVAAPVAAKEEKKGEVQPSSETKNHNEAIAAPVAEKQKNDPVAAPAGQPENKDSSKAKEGGIAAAVGVAAAATAAAVTQPKETAETVQQKLQEKEAPQQAEINGATPTSTEAAAVGSAGTAEAAAAPKKKSKKSSKETKEPKSEIAAKQEQLSQGPASKASAAPSATPIAARYERTSPTSETAPSPILADSTPATKTSSRKINGKSGGSAAGATAGSLAAVTAGGSAAAAATSGGASGKPSKDSKSEKSETVRKQETISSGPIAASAGNKTAAAPALEGQTGAPSTPSKSDTVGRKSGSSRFGSKRTKEHPPLPNSNGPSETGVNSPNATTAAPASSSGPSDYGSPARYPSTPKKGLTQGSRKKSFFGRIKEKLSGGSPSK